MGKLAKNPFNVSFCFVGDFRLRLQGDKGNVGSAPCSSFLGEYKQKKTLSMFLLVSLETFALEFSVTEGTLGPGSCPFLAIVGPWPSLVCAVAGGDGESR